MTTAATAAPVRYHPEPAARTVPLSAARLLWIELRRNPMPLMLPLIALLFWFDSYRPSTGTAPIYVVRTFWNMGQGHTIVDVGPFTAGMAAWIGSREGRRGTVDLAAATARPRWAVQLITWAATAIWAVAAYLVLVGAMFGAYAYQGVGGTPPWWWVAVGATGVIAFSAAGFAVGVFFPSRYAAPLATFGGFFAMMMSSQTGFRENSGWALILPTNSNGNYGADSGVLYRWLPDLPIARMMFLAGIAAAALGLFGLPTVAGGRGLRRAAALIIAAGMALTGTGTGLAATARQGHYGVIIPALHDAANDRLIPYTPVCGRAASVPVCLQPAYRRYLSAATSALTRLMREVAGLPGAPARITQSAAFYGAGDYVHRKSRQPIQGAVISGSPPVLRLPLGDLELPGAYGAHVHAFSFELRLESVHAFVGARADEAGTQAQQVVQAALLQGAGLPFARQPLALGVAGLAPSGPQGSGGPGPAAGPVYAAARRFAALPATTQHAWLGAHLAALRTGQLTPGQVP